MLLNDKSFIQRRFDLNAQNTAKPCSIQCLLGLKETTQQLANYSFQELLITDPVLSGLTIVALSRATENSNGSTLEAHKKQFRLHKTVLIQVHSRPVAVSCIIQWQQVQIKVNGSRIELDHSKYTLTL